mgnify:CR=1 FL=1
MSRFISVLREQITLTNSMLEEKMSTPISFYKVQIKGANSDVLNYKQAMDASDNDDYIASMKSEIQIMTEQNIWTSVLHSTMPKDAKVIKSIWSFRRKCNPMGDITKYRSRICAHGGQQQYGRDFTDTYCPVVSWSTVRLLMILFNLHYLRSHQIDYVQVFLQADLKDDVYMTIPK